MQHYEVLDINFCPTGISVATFTLERAMAEAKASMVRFGFKHPFPILVNLRKETAAQVEIPFERKQRII